MGEKGTLREGIKLLSSKGYLLDNVPFFGWLLSLSLLKFSTLPLMFLETPLNYATSSGILISWCNAGN
jgi:hypothetical protein